MVLVPFVTLTTQLAVTKPFAFPRIRIGGGEDRFDDKFKAFRIDSVSRINPPSSSPSKMIDLSSPPSRAR